MKYIKTVVEKGGTKRCVVPDFVKQYLEYFKIDTYPAYVYGCDQSFKDVVSEAGFYTRKHERKLKAEVNGAFSNNPSWVLRDEKEEVANFNKKMVTCYATTSKKEKIEYTVVLREDEREVGVHSYSTFSKGSNAISVKQEDNGRITILLCCIGYRGAYELTIDLPVKKSYRKPDEYFKELSEKVDPLKYLGCFTDSTDEDSEGLQLDLGLLNQMIMDERLKETLVKFIYQAATLKADYEMAKLEAIPNTSKDYYNTQRMRIMSKQKYNQDVVMVESENRGKVNIKSKFRMFEE